MSSDGRRSSESNSSRYRVDRRQFIGGVGGIGLASMAGCLGSLGGGGPIKIGAVYLTSGIAAQMGQSSQAAANVAINQINEDGGINGRDVEAIFRDHGDNPQQQLRSLVQEENVDALLGLTSSGVALNAAPTVRELGVPFTLTDVGTPYLTEYDTDAYGDYYEDSDGRAGLVPNLFRTKSHTAINTYALAKWASDNFGSGTRVAYMGPDYAYGQQVWDYYRAYADGLGAGFEYVEAQFPEVGASDMTPQINTVMDADPDIVLNSFWAGDVVTWTSQAAGQGLFDAVETTQAAISASPENFKALGDTTPEGQQWNAYYYYQGYDNDVNNTFVDSYRDEYSDADIPEVPGLHAGGSYTAPLAYKEAMEAAGGTDPDDVIAELEGLSLDSPMGPTTINPDSHQANVPACSGRTSHDADVPYDGAGLVDTQTYSIDRQEALDLLEGSGLPPGL